MRKITAFAILLVACAAAAAQSTTVSTTGVVDTDGFTWSYGSYRISFVPNPSWPSPSTYQWTGGNLQNNLQFNGSLSSTGTFSVSIPSNTAISPAGSQWKFSICPNANSGCFSVTLPVTGSTQDVTAAINASAIGPRFPISDGIAYGYGTVEVNPTPANGNLFYDVTNGSTYQHSPSGWSLLAPGTPGGSNQQVQFNNSGAFGGSANLIFNPNTNTLYTPQISVTGLNAYTGNFTTSLSAAALEGSLYADQWQSSAGSNNGIAMSVTECASLPYACEVVAPALYAQTEAEPWGGAFQWNGNTVNQFRSAPAGPASGQPLGCIEDLRFGGPQWVCQQMAPPSWAANTNISVGPSFTTYSVEPVVSGIYNAAPALRLSSYNLFGTTFQNSTSQSQSNTLDILDTNDADSEMGAIHIMEWANAIGDAIPVEIEHIERGGLSTGDSEGAEIRTQMQEAPDVYQGTVNSIASQPGTSNICYGPCTIFNTTQTQGYKGSLGSGLALIDLTQADSSGYISLISGGTVTATGADWDTAYGDSVYTTTTAQGPTQSSRNPLLPLTNVALSVVNATGFTAPGTACITDASGTFWETAPITAVNTSANTITLGTLRSSNLDTGSTIAEGGMACMGISFTADNVGPGNFGAQGYPGANTPVNTIRTTWVIAYNSSGNVLQVMPSNEGWGLDTLAWTQMGSGGSVSCTLSGGSISSCTASGGTGYLNGNPQTQAPPQLTISGLTGCTTNPSIYIATVISGALSTVGIADAGAGCSGTPTVTVTPTNSYAVYPMARTINVYNPATGLVDGSSIATEPLAGTFAQGDTVEQEHYHPESYQKRDVWFQYQGGAEQQERIAQFYGRGFYYYDFVRNNNLPTFYQHYPGGGTPYLPGYGQDPNPPTYAALRGPWSVGLNFQYPLFGAGLQNNVGGAIVINCTVGGVNVCAGWNAYENLLNLFNANNNGGASDVLEYNPSTETWQWTAGASSVNGTGAAQTTSFDPTNGLQAQHGTGGLYPVLDAQATTLWASAVGGTAQAQTASATRLSPALAAGMMAFYVPSASNTGAAPTFAWDGLAAKTVKKCGGSASLVASDLSSGYLAALIYDGSYWELLNPLAVTCGSAPSAATATALAATPSQCTGSQFSTGIAANGNANCATPPTASPSLPPVVSSTYPLLNGLDIPSQTNSPYFSPDSDDLQLCTGSTTVAAATPTSALPIFMVEHTSATTVNDCAGWTGGYRRYLPSQQPSVSFYFAFPGSTDITNNRFWGGLTNSTSTLEGADAPTTSYAAIRFSPSSAGDTTFVCVAGNSSTSSSATISVTPAAGTLYTATVSIGSSTVTCTVNGVSATVSASVPTTGDDQAIFVNVNLNSTGSPAVDLDLGPIQALNSQ